MPDVLIFIYYSLSLLTFFFVFYQLNFIVIFPSLIKYYHIMIIIFVFLLGCDRSSGLFFSCPLCFLPYSRLSSYLVLFLSYFILAVPMRECLGKHSCMSSLFPIAILNGTCLFPTVQLQVHNVYSERKTRNSCALVNLCL